MTGRPLLPHLLAVAVLTGACLPAWAIDDLTPRPQRTFTDKPRIEDYADYNAFLVDIMEYRRQKQERLQARSAPPAPAASLSDDTLASVSGQRDVDLRELYEITSPESLEDALERAQKLPHPTYEEAERYGRTTSTSFPMAPMEGDDMSSREVSGNLQDLELLNPDTFRNPGDEEQAAHVLAKDPGNDDDARDVQATEGVAEALRPFYDLATRIITDSDGRKLWVPIAVQTEAGYTLVRRFDIEVGVVVDGAPVFNGAGSGSTP